MNIARNTYSFAAALVEKFRNQRLRSKLFIVYLLVTILPVTYLVSYSYHTVREQLIHQAVENVNSTIDQINTNISSKLNMYTQITTLLYLDNQLRNYLLNQYSKRDLSFLDAYDYINKTLYKILAMNPNLKSISIYTDNHTLFTDGLFIKYLDKMPADMREKTYKAQGNLIHFYSEPAEGAERTITLARSLNYLSLNYPYGIISMEITEREIYSFFEKENKNKMIFIADEQGNIITAGSKAAGIRNISELDSTGYMVIRKTITNGWQTVVLLPYSEVLGQARKASANMLVISIACMAAAALFIYLTSTFMTKRFETLLQQIRKVERGSFQLPAAPLGNDEVGQLSLALHRMAATIEELFHDVYKKELAANEAEMTSLQAQINPHFLYNTLASISALATIHNNPQVHRMADDLARFYRISLNKGKKSITIEKELKLTEHYVSIQKNRFEGLFEVHYDLDESLFPYTTLKLIIQPFIENCINHAIWDDESRMNIIVRLKADGDDVIIQVIDDGMGMAAETAESLLSKEEGKGGYGIFNVDKRIKLAYGEGYGVKLFSRLGIGTSVVIRIPKSAIYL
ncbi:cache domain-containing sensor histidine kinase [Paenibacillus gansuensis]|uniref:Sensor histidine kinase n=1 Tax=Paenibacillus gansuensis TaxID=306542 RepID=A0ABW5P7Y0_9BACL